MDRYINLAAALVAADDIKGTVQAYVSALAVSNMLFQELPVLPLRQALCASVEREKHLGITQLYGELRLGVDP